MADPMAQGQVYRNVTSWRPCGTAHAVHGVGLPLVTTYLQTIRGG
jgi:hypothetical protein